ncbi:MAG: DUF4412 domain-containing protein [Chlorobiaceae bacterium]|nr:DUF4412 domain-containing protein [Chlorobiaceae bacterium]
MNNISRCLLAVVLLPALLLSACGGKGQKEPGSASVQQESAPLVAAPFEGIMYMTTTIPGAAKGEMKLFIGKKGVRTESRTTIEGKPSGIAMTVISPSETPNKVFIINEANGSCMEIDISKAKAEGAVDPFKDAKIENLGKETVNGYNCTHIRISEPGKDTVIEMWVTKDILDYFTYARMQGGRDKSMSQLSEKLKAAGVDGFPVKTLLKPSGVVTELTKVERSSLDDALFKVPANATKMEIPTSPQGMTKEKMKEMQEMARKMQQMQKQ